MTSRDTQNFFNDIKPMDIFRDGWCGWCHSQEYLGVPPPLTEKFLQSTWVQILSKFFSSLKKISNPLLRNSFDFIPS